MATITDPKAFTTYRTDPKGWAACHKKTGHAQIITEDEAKRIQEANAPQDSEAPRKRP